MLGRGRFNLGRWSSPVWHHPYIRNSVLNTWSGLKGEGRRFKANPFSEKVFANPKRVWNSCPAHQMGSWSSSEWRVHGMHEIGGSNPPESTTVSFLYQDKDIWIMGREKEENFSLFGLVYECCNMELWLATCNTFWGCYSFSYTIAFYKVSAG